MAEYRYSRLVHLLTCQATSWSFFDAGLLTGLFLLVHI
jgi:hypothetical protein